MRVVSLRGRFRASGLFVLLNFATIFYFGLVIFALVVFLCQISKCELKVSVNNYVEVSIVVPETEIPGRNKPEKIPRLRDNA